MAPEAAASELVESLLATLPRRRSITLALVGLGPQAGLVATPWVVAGVLSRLVERERTPVTVVLLGEVETGEMALRKATRRTSESELRFATRDREVCLRPLGEERAEPARIPREIVGSNLLVIAPLLHRRAGARVGGRETWLGPVAGALGSLARSFGLARASKSPERLVAAGHHLLGEVFASASLLIDATWAGVAEPESELPESMSMLRKLTGQASEPSALTLSSELVAPECVLTLAELGRLALPSLLGVDHWLAHLLGLGVRVGARFEGPSPEVAGPLERWPHSLAGSRGPDPGLAGRAITGLRNQGSKAKAKVGAMMTGSSPRAALPARVPGRFASEWTRRWYGEDLR